MQAYCRQKILLILSLVIFSTFHSSMSFAETFNWQRPYAGIYLGDGFGNNHVSTNTGSATNTSYLTTSPDIQAINIAGSSTNTPNSAIAGIQIGHDWVFKNMVYGIVTDYSILPLSSSHTSNKRYPDSADSYSVYTSMSTQWLFTLRGRLGYQTLLHWPSLLYFTGGMAMTKLKVHNSFSDTSALAGIGGINTSENQIGWTLGTGIELATFSHATIDIEYLYVRIPSEKASSSISNSAAGFGIPAQSFISPFTTTGDFYANVLRVGINYRFDE